jgi:glycosyltransferase involved in cell wall biosynthesis
MNNITPEEVSKWKGFFPDGRKLKILVVPANEGGCAYYRAWSPYQKLAELYPNVAEIKFDKNPLGLDEEKGKMPVPEEYEHENLKWADVVVMNNISNFGGPYTTRVCGMAKEFGKFFHMDTDDLLQDLYEGHRLSEVYKEKGLSEMTKFIYSHSDLVSVTQSKFADRVAPFCSAKLAVVKNAVDYRLPAWNADFVEAPRKKLVRICWAGGIHHEEDVKVFSGIPNFVNGRVGRENLVWNFYGSPPPATEENPRDWQHDVWDNYKKIIMRGFKGGRNWNIFPALPAHEYGRLYSVNDVAIAPLQMNPFNDSKSDIKVAECGRYGIPLIASDVGCYNETIKNGVTGYLVPPNASAKEWISILSKALKDKKHLKEMGQNLKKIVDEYYDLNKVVHYRLLMYKECLNV